MLRRLSAKHFGTVHQHIHYLCRISAFRFNVDVQKRDRSSDARRFLTMFRLQHDTIRNTMGAFDGWYRKMQDPHTKSNDSEMLADYGKFIEFLREYVLPVHNKMEEEALFSNITDYGFSLVDYHSGIHMESDHKLCEDYVDSMANSIDENGQFMDKDKALHSVREFIQILALHSQKEDFLLFPRIAEQVPTEQMEVVSQETEKFLAKHEKTQKHYFELAKELCDKYGTEVQPHGELDDIV